MFMEHSVARSLWTLVIKAFQSQFVTIPYQMQLSWQVWVLRQAAKATWDTTEETNKMSLISVVGIYVMPLNYEGQIYLHWHLLAPATAHGDGPT